MASAKHRILVIDDEAFVRDLLSDFFDKLEYPVATAANGDLGIAAFKKERYDVVLVDLKMPGKSGIDTLRELRRINKVVPVVIMTGYPTIDSSIEALRLGAYDYVIKPFKLQGLREVVDRAIKEQEFHEEIEFLQTRINDIEQELRAYRAQSGAQLRERGRGTEQAVRDSS